MAYEHKEGTGALFSNAKTKETQPDVRGNIMIEGKLYKLAGWLKKKSDGSDWISLKIDEKQESAPATTSFGSMSAPASKDDLPF